MSTTVIIALSITAAVAAIAAIFFIWVRVTQQPIHGLLAKTFASMVFVAMGGVALIVSPGFTYAPMFLLGLAFGMVGDILLDLKRAHSEHESLYLITGMIAFGLGHAAYLIGVIFYANVDLLLPALVSLPIAAVLAVGSVVTAKKMMHANFGKFLGISTGYAFILSYMTVLSIWLAILNHALILMAVGMVLFLLSDLVLSVMYFVEGKKEDKLLVVVNHGLYYAAQIVIAAFMFL